MHMNQYDKTRLVKETSLHLQYTSIFFFKASRSHSVYTAQPVSETVLYKSRIFPRFLFSFLTTVGPTKVKTFLSDREFNCGNCCNCEIFRCSEKASNQANSFLRIQKTKFELFLKWNKKSSKSTSSEFKIIYLAI